MGSLTKNSIYVWADTYAENAVEKLMLPFVKGQYILVYSEEKLHILTLSSKQSMSKVKEQVTYNLQDLHRISITNLWSYNKPVAKMITFKVPTWQTHKYRVPYEAHEFEHKKQKEHVLDLVEVLLPTD